ncbi:MAG TPA: hypothetical protein VFU35_01200, partial [Jatrophihabitans sp.]|nr:hypothetical protein [Jatrophihabitans sp.]
DPPSKAEIAALRAHVDALVAKPARRLLRAGPPDRVVATSKTFVPSPGWPAPRRPRPADAPGACSPAPA